jgi:hypothetical protein
MSFHAIDVPVIEKEIKIRDHFPPFVTLDEHGNIYLIEHDQSTLWIYRPESSTPSLPSSTLPLPSTSTANVWERRNCSPSLSFLGLICVRKNHLYAACRHARFRIQYVVIDLDDADLKYTVFKIRYHWFPRYEVWENEIRFYRHEERFGSYYQRLTSYEVFRFDDRLWKDYNMVLSKFKVILDIRWDEHVCLRGDVLYVRHKNGIKKYFSDGTCRWIYKKKFRNNCSCRECLSFKEFLQVGYFFCFLESETLVLVSLEGTVIRKLPCPFDVQEMTCTSNGVYMFKYYEKNRELKATRYYPECLLLKEITFEQVAKNLKNYSHSELRSRIGNLAERFIEMRC